MAPAILEHTVRLWSLILLFIMASCPELAQAAQDPARSLQAWPAETRSAETGLRIWQFPAQGESAFSLLILVGVGSRDESPAQAGISHFLEHCLFLSTQERSEAELIEGLREKGGTNNGRTTEDWTAYWVTLPVQHWRYGVDWLTEQLARPRFDPKEVAREQGIVIEEIQTRHQHGRPPTFEALLYGDHPLGRSIAGSETSVRNTDLEAVQGWHDEHYRLDNLVVAFAGKVPSRQCTELIGRRLAHLEHSSSARESQPLEPRLGRSLLRTGMRSSGDRRGFLIQGYLIEPGDATDLASLLLSKELLDESVFDEIRTNRGLAYAPQAELQIHDAVWRFDSRIEVGESKNLPSVLEGSTLAFASLGDATHEAYLRAKATVLGSLTASSPQGLLYCTELAWALLSADGTPDLPRIVSQLDLDRYSRRIASLLPPEREFVISDSVNLISPSLGMFWIFILALAAAAGLIWWLPRRLRQRRTHRAPRRPRPKVAPALAPPAEGDVDEIERQFDTWFKQQDGEENDKEK